MKKILITGANSYIGTSFEKYINDNYADQYQVDTIDKVDMMLFIMSLVLLIVIVAKFH